MDDAYLINRNGNEF